MKYRIAIGIYLFGCCAYAGAAQQYHEARCVAMGGTGVAGLHPETAPLLNPALPALERHKPGGYPLSLPSLGPEEDKERHVDSFLVLQHSFQALEQAVADHNAQGISQNSTELLAALRVISPPRMKESVAVDSLLDRGALRVSVASFSRRYWQTVAGSAGADNHELATMQSTHASSLEEQDPGEIMLAGAVADHGLAISFPLSIVNMPVTVGLSPKLQRLESFSNQLNVYRLTADELTDNHYQRQESAMNVDLGMAVEPAQGLVLGLSGRNLVSQELQYLEIDGQMLSYRLEPRVTLGVTYDWSAFSVSSDIDLTQLQDVRELPGAQYWRLGAEVMATDWLALRLGYRTDLLHNNADTYSLGTGFAIGQSFKLDLTGVYGVDDALGAVLQTSYHF